MDYVTSYAPEASAGPSPLFWVVYFAFMGLLLASLWKIFSKAGIAGWKCLIPIYNAYLEFKICFGNGWLFLLSFVPLVNIVVSFMLMFRLAKVFGKGVGFGFGLLFLGPIFLPMLAFGSAKYVGIDRT